MKLIIFDYDDTLFPSTYYTKNTNLTIDDLNVIDNTVYNIFKTLQDNGHTVIIISNGNMAWINESMALLPNTKNYFINNKIQIISARDLYENTAVKYEDWKRFTTVRILTSEPYYIFDNILGIGDSTVDNIAIKDSCKFVHKKYEFIKIPPALVLSMFNDMIERLYEMIKSV